MAKNFVQEGDVLEISNSTGSTIASGSVVLKGNIVGIALGDIANGASGSVSTCGVYEVAKTTPLVISQGDQLFYSTSTNKVTKTATDKFIGLAAADAGSSAATVLVKLSEAGDDTPQAANVAQETTANGSDAATTQALANALKTKVNAVLTALKNAGLMAPDA